MTNEVADQCQRDCRFPRDRLIAICDGFIRQLGALDSWTKRHQNPLMTPSKPRKQYTPEFKAQAIELLTIGRPVAELAEELCISANLLYSWKSSSQAAQGGSEGGRAEGENDAADAVRRLRREIALLRQENDILKKAAVILGTKIHPNYAR